MQPGAFYHIFNHANGEENLFRNKDNYSFFLKRYIDLVSPVCKTYAYCLMPNHFHFLVEVRTAKELMSFFDQEKSEGQTFPKFQTLEKLSSRATKQFGNLFSSYTQAYNKVFNRKGSLFIKNFKRKAIAHPKYYKSVVEYFHQNPVHHGFVERAEDWEFSSYHSFLSKKATRIERQEVLDWYGGADNFQTAHGKKANREITQLFSIEL